MVLGYVLVWEFALRASAGPSPVWILDLPWRGWSGDPRLEWDPGWISLFPYHFVSGAGFLVFISCEGLTVLLLYRIDSGMSPLQTSCPEDHAWTTLGYLTSSGTNRVIGTLTFSGLPDSSSENAWSCSKRRSSATLWSGGYCVYLHCLGSPGGSRCS